MGHTPCSGGWTTFGVLHERRGAHLATGTESGAQQMKSNLKWYITRAVLFLGSSALAAGVIVDRGMRF